MNEPSFHGISSMQPLGFLVDHNLEKWGMVGQTPKHQFGFGTR